MDKTLDCAWYRLDNAAKIYPALVNSNDSCVFRIAANLTQNVVGEVLQQAVIDLGPRFPSLYVKLRDGFFWNYYEANEKTPVVMRESCFVNKHIDLHANHNYHFTVFHYRNRISLEVFHGLCDGSGALEYLKALVYRYAELTGLAQNSEGLVLTANQTPAVNEAEDSFAKYFTPAQHERGSSKKAHRIQGTRFANGLGVISGKMHLEQLHALAKENKATITQYLAALLTYCIGQSRDAAASKKPINICVTVDLRRYYSSRTLRNFSLYFNTSTDCQKDELSFEEILEQVKADFASELTREKLQKNLNANVAIERNFALRICPLLIKHVGIRIGCSRLGEKLKSCTLSNLGNVALPSSLTGLVRDFECHMPVGKDATHGISVMSYNGRMTVSFSRKIRETKIEELFFETLARRGVEVEIQSNLWENYA